MNQNQLRFKLALLTVMVIFSLSSIAQINEGGIPLSFSHNNLPEKFNHLELQKPNLENLIIEDQINEESAYPDPERMAVSIPVNKDIKKAGTMQNLADGSCIWRLKIEVPDALALGVYYSNLYLPEGSRLFLYNENKTQVIGAFSAANNHESGLFATEFIQGDKVTLEYIEPAGNNEEASIFISEVAYAYRYINFEDYGREVNISLPCMINVACEEGDGWEDQSRGVARISIKIGYYYYWCSGSLINTTENDRTPYFLTAEHCGEGASASDRNQWIFYFNYQASTCGGNYGPSSNSVTGCTLKAKDPLTTGFDGPDFELIKLNSTPPISYNVYYNGWNRTNVPADSGVCLHHPAGDIKKVSTYHYMISSTWWNGTPSHWRVIWSETANGLSIMEGGSSGSAIFDQDGLIMGDLSGGYTTNTCENPSPAWYGKIWYSWDQAGSIPAERLKDWLDPINTGVNKQPGLSSQILPPIVNFTVDTTYILQGETVYFTDLTTGNPALEWDWSFPGGTPNQSDVQNPIVTYNQYGTFDVSLTVTNADGTQTEIKSDYMTIEQVLAPEAEFSASAVEIIEGDMIDFTDLTINEPTAWAWQFEGATPDTSNEQNPASVEYLIPGVYDVTLTATNNGGTSSEFKDDYIIVNTGIPPVSDFYADVTQIMLGDTVNFFDLSAGNPTQWTWTFYGGEPGASGMQNPTGIIYNTEGMFDVKLRTKNAFGNNTITKEQYIMVGNVGVRDINLHKGVMIYPNPSQGVVNVKLLEGKDAWGHGGREAGKQGSMVEVSVINSLGKEIRSFDHDPSDPLMVIDLSNESNGIYFVRLTSGNRTVRKKVSILK